jgi:hypothetical protein
MDMSRFDADLPQTAPGWWAARSAVIPAVANLPFQGFLAALTAYAAAPAANVLNVSTAATILIEALPNGPVPAPARERIAMALPDGRLRNMLRPSGYSSLTQSQNLILGLNNLLKIINGGIVPLSHRNL